MNELLTVGWKSVAPDLTSWHDRTTRWYPGTTIKTGGRKGGSCPVERGDGVCLALNFLGAAGTGAPCITAVLVAYAAADVLGQDDTKVRVSACTVLDVLDISRLIRQGKFHKADLYGANLARANLYGANLGGADLRMANLGGADLGGADLRGANLRGADLRGADLRMANLGGADLGGADLGGADLRGANLERADAAKPTFTRQSRGGESSR